MECLEIDWKSIDETFVKDEFYEAIQAPKWVDFNAPEQQVDDTDWFCGKAGCSHAKKPAPQPCNLAGKTKAPFKERLRVLDAEPQNPVASMTIIPPEKIAISFLVESLSLSRSESALTRGVISTSVNPLLGMKSKPLPQKNKVFMQGKITSTIRCKITSENDNPNQVPKQISSSTSLLTDIRFPENAVKRANRVETRDLPKEVKVLPKRPLTRALSKEEEQIHKKCNTGNNSLLNASDPYVHRKQITGKQKPYQGYSYGQSCKSAKLATKSATQAKRILSTCRLNRDCRASAKTKQLRNFALPETKGPASLSLIDARSALSTSSSASQESGDVKGDYSDNLIKCKDMQLMNQVIVETEEKDSSPEQFQEESSEKINDGKVATVEQNVSETKFCQRGNSTQESRILEALLNKLILTNSNDNEKHYEEDARPQEKDKPEEERESKEEIQGRPNEQVKGRKRKSTELNFKLNCSSKQHGKKYNKIMMPTPSSTSASQSVVSGRRPRPIAGFCAGQHKKLRIAISSPVQHKPCRLVPQVKETLREVPDLCSSSIVTETQTEDKEEIKKAKEQMMHHALKMPFFGKPFKPQRSTKKLTVPKEPRFHTRERKTCIKNRIVQ